MSLLGCDGFNSNELACDDFKTGSFIYKTSYDGVDYESTVVRSDELEIETFEGVADTSTVRWVSDCEYIVTHINAKTNADRRPAVMRILRTEGQTFTFEYKPYVDAPQTVRGTATKLD